MDCKVLVKEYIKKHEGLRLKPYEDDYSGTERVEYSIGYGHQIQPNEDYLYSGITKEQAEELLNNDLEKFRNFVKRFLDRNYPKYNDCQLWSLIHHSYCTGLNWANEKTATLLQQGRIEEFWDLLQKRGIYYKGKRLPQNEKMREFEKELFFFNETESKEEEQKRIPSFYKYIIFSIVILLIIIVIHYVYRRNWGR